MKLSSIFAPERRRRTFAVLTVLMLALAFALNLGLTYLVGQRQIFLDTTPEGLHTLTDRMVKECDALLDEGKLGEEPIRILFCADPDQLTESAVLRPIYFMALQLRERFDCVAVDTVNVTYEPNAVAAYKTTSLSKIAPTDIIVSHGDTYRIASADSFWTTANNAYWSFNGEYKLASLILSLLGTQKVAYFVTGHGETVFDPENPTSEESLKCATLYDLLVERGLRVDTLNLKEVDAVPSDCALLIVNDPKSDFESVSLDSFFARSECEKIDRYLVENQGALAVARDYKMDGKLENLDHYLFEWGFDFGDTLVKDEKESLIDPDAPNTTLIGQYNGDTGSYGYAIYGDFAALDSAPSVIVKDTGYIRCAFDESPEMKEDGSFYTSRNYGAFLRSSANAKTYAYDDLTGGYDALDHKAGAMDLCSVSVRMTTDSYSSERSYSYVFAAASGSFFSEETLGNASYANYDVTSALIQNISRVDEYASTDLGGTSLNSTSFGGKQLLDTAIATSDTQVYNTALEVVEINYTLTAGMKIFYIVLTTLPVLGALAVGIAVCVRRRYL